MKFLLVPMTLAMLSIGMHAMAQEESNRGPIDDLVNSLAEQMDEDGTLDEAATEGLAELRALADNPIDLSTATESELANLVFLDERKAKAIVRHRLRAGGIKTEQELMTIRGLTATDILILRQIARIGTPRDTSTLRPVAKVNAIFRIGRRYPLARGYKSTDEKEAAYQGGPLKTLFRVKAEEGGRLAVGLVGDNDSGEPQMKNGSGLMDFYGGFASYSPARGPIRKVVAGHYNVRLGQGLGIWTGFGLSPTAMGISAARSAMGVSASMSAAESGYLRGVAVEARVLPFRMTAFASWVDADATTKTSADSSTYITTIRTSGYHRTATERKYRHNDLLTTVGAYASADVSKLRLGLGVNNWHTALPLGFDGQAYRQFYPTGHNITTASLDARIVTGRFHIYGEMATQGKGANGGVAGFDWDICSGKSLSASVRRFGKHYFAQMQQPVSHSSKAGGESGIFIGGSLSPFRRTEVSASIDAWKLRCLQRNVYMPTKGFRVRAQVDYNLTRHSLLTFRLRFTDQETTTGSKDDWQPATLRSTSLKLLYKVSPTRRLDLTTLAERTSVHTAAGANDVGLLAAQTLKLTTSRNHLVVSLSGSLFNTDSYAARTYTRRPMVLYDMAFATCYGKGATATAMLTVKPTSQLKIWLWCTHTRYTDRDVIGTSNEQTNGPRRTDVKLQIQWKLYWHKQPQLWPATKG